MLSLPLYQKFFAEKLLKQVCEIR